MLSLGFKRSRPGDTRISLLVVVLAVVVCLLPHVSSFACRQTSRRIDNRHNPSFALSATTDSVRFLGRGDRAIVRPGVVLCAPAHEFHHYLRQAAIFIHAMGENDFGEFVVRGVIIDHPTPFTLKEMTDENPAISASPLGENLLFRGGGDGGDGVILLHDKESLGQSAIGVSGIYQGGWDAALAACADGKADADDFKIFFQHCQFTENELEDLLQSDEDGDGWTSVEVQPDVILNPDWDRGDAWQRLRNAVAQM